MLKQEDKMKASDELFPPSDWEPTAGELEVLVKYWKREELAHAFALWKSGIRSEGTFDTQIDGSYRVLCLSHHLGEERIDALGRLVEEEFSRAIGSDEWRRFVDESVQSSCCHVDERRYRGRCHPFPLDIAEVSAGSGSDS